MVLAYMFFIIAPLCPLSSNHLVECNGGTCHPMSLINSDSADAQVSAYHALPDKKHPVRDFFRQNTANNGSRYPFWDIGNSVAALSRAYEPPIGYLLNLIARISSENRIMRRHLHTFPIDSPPNYTLHHFPGCDSCSRWRKAWWAVADTRARSGNRQNSGRLPEFRISSGRGNSEHRFPL
jgi:hypothetical protein